MSWYREKYLKSDDWRNMRQAVKSWMAPKNKCMMCGEKFDSLDAHHIKYRNLYDALPWELRVVCRSCHTKIHDLLDFYPELKSLTHNTQWSFLKAKMFPDRSKDDVKKEIWRMIDSDLIDITEGIIIFSYSRKDPH